MKLLKFTGKTKGHIPADQILEANKGCFDEVFLIGIKDGEMAFASSTGDMKELLFRLNEFAHKFYNGEFDDYE